MIERFFIAIVVLLFTSNPAVGQDKATQQVETDHLLIVWQEGNATDKDVEVVQADGEKYYTVIRGMLGDEPDFKVVIMLNGPAQQPDGSWGYPHVDSWGRIHMYNFGPTHHSYFSALAHEMVHTFRIQRSPHHDWFFEEGLAEFVALRVDESLAGFPWYGFSPTIVAGQWFDKGESIPLQKLRDDHRALNQPCKAQSYSLRSHFFDYLGKTFGDDKVLSMAAEKEAGALGDYTQFFGKDFDTLAAEWQASLLADYRAIDNVAAQARDYRKTPVMYGPICKEGEDF